MLHFFQSTPRYEGEGQPTADCGGGLLGMLGLFGGGLFPRTPAYQSPPVNGKATPAEPPPAGEPEPEKDTPEPEPIEGPGPEQRGPVTITITRAAE
jgi:hypothetical protein